MALSQEQLLREGERRKKLFKEYTSSPDFHEKLITRLKVNDACDRSSEAKAYTWKLCERPDNTVEGIKFFINNFGWTFNPRPEASPHHIPFILFPFQEKAIAWMVDHLEKGLDGLVEKSREMGISWLVFVAVPVYYWLFRDGTNFLLGSYKEALVDDKSVDSLFGKIDYFIKSIPKWMLPRKFNHQKHRTSLKLINPSNNNAITGDTMNPNFGRGSRKTAILFDELAHWDYAKDAWESSTDATSCKIANSTPCGYDYFAMLRESGMDVLTIHWKEHPLKDDIWYQFEKQRRTEEEVAQELDISYTKSREGRVYPEWNETNIETGLFEYSPDLPLYIGWDFGRSDDTAIIWLQKEKSGKVRIIDTYRNTGKNIEFYIPFITGIVNGESQYRYSSDEFDIINKHQGWKRATHFGDPAGRFQNQVSDETVFTILRSSGIVVNFKDNWKEFNLRKSKTKRLIMDGIHLNSNPRTQYFGVCIMNSSYPKTNESSGMVQINSAKPKHDAYSHYRSALEYLAIGLDEFSEWKKQTYDKFKKRDVNIIRKKTIGY